MRYYLIAGEASGDMHGSNLMLSLKKYDSDAQFRFFGGDMMSAAGGVRVKHYNGLAYMGFWPVLTHLGTIVRNGKMCFADICEWRPDAVILIDYPGFNLSIAKRVREKLGIPVYYYISPKLWAWKGYRIKNIKRDVNEVFSILPFEVDYFEKNGYRVNYVGNPTADAIEQYRRERPLETAPAARPCIALLAGSRRQEISRNLPKMLKAVKGLDSYELVLAAAPGIDDEFYSQFIGGYDVQIVRGCTYQVLDGAKAALVTSGTATLETALLRVPQVVCYFLPVHFVGVLFKKFVLKIEYVSLVNLICGRGLVPELLAGDMNPDNIRRHLLPLLEDSEERRMQLDGYDELIRILGPSGASDKAASKIVKLLDKVKEEQQQTDSRNSQ